MTAMDGNTVISITTFKIDPSKTPKTIDVHGPSKGGKEVKVGLGIYEFKDPTTLTICMGMGRDNGGDDKRPNTFADTEKTLAIVFLKKDKAAESDVAVSPKQASKDQGPLFGGKPASFWLNQLQDANPKFRAEAVEALGSFAQKNKELIPAVANALRDTSEVGRVASNVLAALGPDAVPAILEVMKEEHSPSGL